MSPGLTDASGADNSDSWNSEKHFVRTPVDLHRKLIQISERPVALRIQSDIKRIMGFTEKLVCAESIKPQQPVRLIQPVFPQQRRLRIH